MDVKKFTTNTYDKIAVAYNKRNNAHFWVDEFKYYVSIFKGKRIIDLGCGAGRDAEEFAKTECDYVGIDLSQGMLDVAKKRVPSATFIKADFYKLPFKDDYFDGFWAAASLLHVPKKEIISVLNEIRRITKKGGVGFVSVKKKTSLDEGLINKSGELSTFGGRYFSFYDMEEFSLRNYTLITRYWFVLFITG